MRRRQHPHIDRNIGFAAQPLDAAFLQHAQQFALGVRVQVADFIQEERAAVGLLETADAPGLRAGERAAFVPEEFALQQRVRDGRAIDGDERLVRPVAVLVNRPRDQFLAGAGRAADEDSRGRGGHAADFLVDRLHGAAVADDGRAIQTRFAHIDRLRHQPAAGHGRGDQIEQFIGIQTV